jgi:hypothetical protein
MTAALKGPVVTRVSAREVELFCRALHQGARTRMLQRVDFYVGLCRLSQYPPCIQFPCF